MLGSALNKKRIVGLALLSILLALFLLFNRIPKLDTVRADLDGVSSPAAECFQGFCIEADGDSSLLSRWWSFSVTYMRLVAAGMTFAFLVAGLAESFLFPPSSGGLTLRSGTLKGTLKGLAVGPVVNLCSACIVPISAAFRRRGGGLDGSIAMVQSSSTLNLPALIMVVLVFTPVLGGSRIVLSVVGALLIGPLVALVVGERGRPTLGPYRAVETLGQDTSPWSEVLKEAFREWIQSSLGHLVRLGPIMVLAGFASGLAIQWISPDVIATYLGNDVRGVAIAATFGILINVPLLFEIPLVAVLLLFGMGAAPAATLLFAAAAGGPITFWGLARLMPRRAVATFATATWAVGLAGGLAIIAIGSFAPESEIGLKAAVVSASVVGVASDEQAPALTHRLPGTADSNTGAGTAGPSSRMAPGELPADEITPFTNVAQTALTGGFEVMNYRPSAVVFDYDRDGDSDLYVTSEAGYANRLYSNEGDGTFVDVADAAGVGAAQSNSSGAIACDLNNDGYQDLYVGARGIIGDELDFRSASGDDDMARELRVATADRLFLNNGDGTFGDVTERAFGDATNLRSAASIACGDVDGDGWLDIYVGNAIDEDYWIFDQPSHPGHYNVLYRNNGDLTFDEVANEAGVDGGPITMRDPDGQPIVFEDAETGSPYEGYDPNIMDAAGNRVADPSGRTHAVMFFDHDGDGDGDLWVANDGYRPYVFRNDSSPGDIRFTPVAEAMGIDKSGNWMGFAVGDYDGDADLDVFVTNIGYHQRVFPRQEEAGGDCRYTERFAWGTCLHALWRSDGTREVAGLGTIGAFQDVAPATEVTPSALMPSQFLNPKIIHPDWEVPTGLGGYDFGYGATFFDFDNDGDQDLYWLGSEGPPGYSAYPAAGRMLRGDGRGAFEDITVRANLLDILDVDYSVLDRDDPRFDATAQRIHNRFALNGKGVAHGDLNGDGYVDLIGTNSSGPHWDPSLGEWVPAAGPLFVWINGGGENHWIVLRLRGRMGIDGTGSNADGIGARVYVKTAVEGSATPLVQVQDVRAGSSYLSMDSIELEFGIGLARVVKEISILWPSGARQVLRDVAVDRVIVVTEPKQ